MNGGSVTGMPGCAPLKGTGNTLDDLMESDDNITVSVLKLNLRKRKTPFAEGALRLASFARTESSTNRYVVKEFKDDNSKYDDDDDGGQDSRRRTLAHLAEDMRSQALCKAFALEFNLLLGDSPEHAIDFVVTSCFKCDNMGERKGKCMYIEPFLDGKYIKYNGNAGYANDDPELAEDPSNLAAQAFSHFTFERSHGRFLVCDLQGVGKMMTDPAVHTLDPYRFSLSQTNLGAEGFMFFFAWHERNKLCRQLGLQSNGQSLVDGDDKPMQFRKHWRGIERLSHGIGDMAAFCCSNKLCGKILSQAQAATSERSGPSGYHWCDECLPQLDKFMVRQVCSTWGVPHHEFEVSKFFYESQGKNIPRYCPDHDVRESAAKLFAFDPAFKVQ